MEFADILKYLYEDPHAEVIAMYLEGVDNPKALIEVGKQVAKKKPVIAYKICGSSTMNQASYSHTGSLAGRYELYEAALRQAGIINARDCTEMFDIAKALSFCPPLSGDGVAILTGVAGPGIVAANACEKQGLAVPQFFPHTVTKLRQTLALPTITINNPVDLGFFIGIGMHKGVRIAELLLQDERVNSLLAICVYQPMLDPLVSDLTESLPHLIQHYKKPIIMCMVSPGDIYTEEKAQLEANSIPVYPSPERAVTAISGLVEYYVQH